MKTIAAAILAATAVAADLPMPQGAASMATKVCVANQAGFVMDWWMDDLITGQTSTDSDSYPIDKTKCMDILTTNAGVQEGDFLEIYVHAHLGKTNPCTSAIIYSSTYPITATFTCKGTTLNYHCDLNGQAYMAELEQFGLHEELALFKSTWVEPADEEMLQ